MNTKAFYKVMSGLYDLLDVVYFRNYEHSPRRIVLQSIKEQDKVLDLCTGTATNAILIAKARPDAKITGIDLSKEMLSVAKDKRKKEHSHNVSLYCMDATKMKFKSKSFDKVLISLVLHELDEPLATQLILEAKRVLKDDGEIIVTEWEPSKTLWRKALFLPIHLLEPKPYRIFIKKDLHSYFKRSGLDVVVEVHCDYTKVLKLKKSPIGQTV